MSPPIPGLVIAHLATVVPAAFLGAFILLRRKGNLAHRILGRIWVALMLTTSVISFGIQSDGRLSWIHILSVVTIAAIAGALIAIRAGKVETHRRSMQSAYAGMMIAFAFTFLPSRLLGQWASQLFN